MWHVSRWCGLSPFLGYYNGAIYLDLLEIFNFLQLEEEEDEVDSFQKGGVLTPFNNYELRKMKD